MKGFTQDQVIFDWEIENIGKEQYTISQSVAFDHTLVLYHNPRLEVS